MSKPFVLSPDLQQAVASFFQRIPFNQVLGIELDELSHERVTMHLPMKPELIGNFVHGILHGGVISSLLDVCGGAMALIGAFAATAASLVASACSARARPAAVAAISSAAGPLVA